MRKLRNSLISLSPFKMDFKGNLFLSSCLFVLLMISSTSGEHPDLDDIRDFLLPKPNDTDHLTYQQLQIYFEQVTGLNSTTAADQPRLFPLCINTSTLENFKEPRLAAWAPILRAIDNGHPCEDRPLRFYEFNESEHSLLKNRGWIDTIKFSRINTNETDARNMRQWMHITVTPAKPMKAVYLQTIVGSIGLSSGEFSYEFNCSDASPGHVDNGANFAKILPCDYRSRAELNHPTAFFGGDYRTAADKSPIRVHYKWTDISCLETPFLQFIVIAVADFKREPKWGVDFQPMLSPVYSNFEFDSKDGVMTPYYVDWENGMSCFRKSHKWGKSSKLYHDTLFEPLKWNETTVRRLNFNEDYEQCITGKDSDKRDDNRKECLPGPFECPEELNIKAVSDAKGFQAVVDRRQAEFKEAESLDDCVPCFFPSKEELNCSGELGDENDFVEKRIQPFLHLDYSEYLSSSLDSKIHGAMSILVYCVLMPLSIMIARFYRGIPVRGHDKVDLWIMIHVGLQLLAYLLMWISTGFVTTLYEGYDHTSQHCLEEAEEIAQNSSIWDNEWTQESFEEWLDKCINENRQVSHTTLGITTFIIHNLIVIMSFGRSRSDSIRNIQVIIHSHLGYLVPILSAVSIFFAVSGEHCSELLEYTIILVVINILVLLIASCVTTAEDKSLKIEPRRYKWPILEPIRLSHPGPYYECKVGLLCIYAGFQVFIWVLAVVALSRITLSEDKVLSGVDQGKIIFGIFKSCRSPSLFKPRMFQ